MDMEQLKSILAVIRCGTFLDAAEELHCAQSTVSKNIRRLEQELGVQIFERTTRRVILTPAGEDIAAFAKKILGDYEGMLQAAEYHRNANPRELRIGSIYFGKDNLLVPVVADFMKLHPSLTVTMEESTTTPLLASLRANQLDIVFISSMYLRDGVHLNFSSDESLKAFSFSADPYYVIVSRKHPLAQRDSLDYPDLEGQSLITTDRTMDVYHEAVRKTFDTYGVHIHVATQCTNIRSVLHMVTQNIGIAILSRLVVEETDDLVMIPLVNPLIRDTQMVIRRRKRIPPHIEAFWSFVTSR